MIFLQKNLKLFEGLKYTHIFAGHTNITLFDVQTSLTVAEIVLNWFILKLVNFSQGNLKQICIKVKI